MDKLPIVPKDFLNFSKVEDIQASEHWVFWVEKKAKSDGSGYNSKLVRYDTITGEVRDFTQEGNLDHSPRISPNEKYIAFISDRNGFSQLFRIRMNGGEAQAISQDDEQVKSIAWDPNGNRLAYIAHIDPGRLGTGDEEIDDDIDKKIGELVKSRYRRNREDPRRISQLVYRTGTSYIEDWLTPQVFVHDIQSGSTKRISDLQYDYQGLRWLDTENLLSFTKFDEPADLSQELDLVKLNIDLEHRGDEVARVFHPYIFDKLFWVNKYDTSKVMIQTYEKTYTEGIRYQLLKIGLLEEDGTLTVLNKQLDRSLASIEWVNTFEALTLIHHHGSSEVRKYDHQSGEFSRLYEPQFSVESFSGQRIEEFYVTATSPEHPSAVWKYEDGVMRILHDPNANWTKNKRIIIPEEWWMENEDGVKFQGWFFDAANPANPTPPLLLSIHGGPHIMWNNAGTMWIEWQSQLSSGYSILAMNPVGSDGYGEEFMRVILGNWGHKDARDLLMALERIITQKTVDRDRIYVTGGSYAGFQTVNLLSKTDIFRAACAQRGVYNLLTLDAGGDLANFDEIEYLGPGPKNIEKLWADSPISKVDQITTPLLLIHSENDYRVPIHQAEHLFLELRKRGQEVNLLRYPEEGHELSREGKPRRLIDRLNQMMVWFDYH